MHELIEELDDAREWHFDATTEKLYFLPNGTESDRTAGDGPQDVIAARFETVIAVRGTPSNPVMVSTHTFHHCL